MRHALSRVEQKTNFQSNLQYSAVQLSWGPHHCKLWRFHVSLQILTVNRRSSFLISHAHGESNRYFLAGKVLFWNYRYTRVHTVHIDHSAISCEHYLLTHSSFLGRYRLHQYCTTTGKSGSAPYTFSNARIEVATFS
jgi:hypothetical protein